MLQARSPRNPEILIQTLQGSFSTFVQADPQFSLHLNSRKSFKLRYLYQAALFYKGGTTIFSDDFVIIIFKFCHLGDYYSSRIAALASARGRRPKDDAPRGKPHKLFFAELL